MKHLRILVTVISLLAFVGLTFSSCSKILLFKDSDSVSPAVDEDASQNSKMNGTESLGEDVVSDSENISNSDLTSDLDMKTDISDDNNLSDTSDIFSDTSNTTDVFAEVDISYLAFGDSISRGCMLPSPEEQCYPKKLSEIIDDFNGSRIVEYQNFSIDGQQSDELIELLASKTEEIKNSDIISISTGANNILSVMTDKTKEIMEKNGLEISDIYNSGKIFSEIISGSADSSLYRKVYLTFSEINSYINGPIFKMEIGKAAARLNSDLPQIVEIIKEQNPDAVIVINTIYNPYKDFNITMGSTTIFSPATIVDEAVSSLNMVIQDNASKLGYKVADVYEAFENYSGEERLVNAYFSFSELFDTNFDVHPSIEGQRIIAETVFESIKEDITK